MLVLAGVTMMLLLALLAAGLVLSGPRPWHIVAWAVLLVGGIGVVVLLAGCS